MVVTLGSDGNGEGFRCKFCNEYSFNLVYFRSHMSVTQTGSRVCNFYFTFDFIYGWGSSICTATFPAARVLYRSCWINNLRANNIQSTLSDIVYPLCFSDQFMNLYSKSVPFFLFLYCTKSLSVLTFWICLWHMCWKFSWLSISVIQNL